MSLDPHLEVHRPISLLRQQFGPYTQQWTLFRDRLEIRASGPFKERFTPLELERIDSVSLVEEVPWLLAGFAGGALLVFFASLVLAALGEAGLGLLFGAATVAGFSLYALGAWKVSWVEVETLGGGCFWLRGAHPSTAEVRRFLSQLRQARGDALQGQVAPELGDYDGLHGWDEADPGANDEGPIDPRWIN